MGNTDGGGPGGGFSAAGVDAAGLVPLRRACQRGTHGRRPRPAPRPRRPRRPRSGRAGAGAGGLAAQRSPAICPGCPGRCGGRPPGGRHRERRLRAERGLVCARAGAVAGGRRHRRPVVPSPDRADLAMAAAGGRRRHRRPSGAWTAGRGPCWYSLDQRHRRGGQVGVRRARPGRGGGERPELAEQRGRVGRWRGLRSRQRGHDAGPAPAGSPDRSGGSVASRTSTSMTVSPW